jgi:hypothetical protein
MNMFKSSALFLAIAAVGITSAHASEGSILRIENTGTQFMVRTFDNAEQCSSDNRGKFVGVSGRNLHRGGARKDNLDIDLTPGQPVEIVVSDASASGGRFRIEPEAGFDYLARFIHAEGLTTIALLAREQGSDGEYAPLNAPDAVFSTDVCPHARWARLDFDTPKPSMPDREVVSSPVRTEQWREARGLNSNPQ